MPIRLCRICTDFHDLDKPWPEACYGHFGGASRSSGPQIIKDIDPYRAVAVDVATGKPPVIRSRRDHRAFLKRNGYVEVGNQPIRERPIVDVPDSRADVARTINQMKEQGRWRR